MISESDWQVAMIGSGCEISKEDLTIRGDSLDENTKKQIFLTTRDMLTKNKFKMLDELLLLHREIQKIAKDFNVHPVVLYYVYMTKLDSKQIE